MADRSPGRRRRQRRAAGIGKEIEHRNRPPGRADALRDKVPVGRLLGKDAGVLKAHRFDVEGLFTPRHAPAFGQRADAPASAARVRTVVYGVGLCPQRRGAFVPDGLRIRPRKGVISPALQPLSAAAVKQPIIVPVRRNPHAISPPHAISFYFTILLLPSSSTPSIRPPSLEEGRLPVVKSEKTIRKRGSLS